MGKMVRTDDGSPLLVKKYSDTPLLRLLKAHHPAKYRDRASIDMTTGGKPLEPSAAKQQFAASIDRKRSRASSGRRAEFYALLWRSLRLERILDQAAVERVASGDLVGGWRQFQPK